jgi:membrane associated rhomboid family serine protease
MLGPHSPGNWIKAELPLTLTGLLSGQWWRLFTCSWVHDDLIGYHTLHLFLNMLSLAALGQVVEGALGRKHFCLLYFPAGLLAVLFYLIEMTIRIGLLGHPEYMETSLVGASGCVMGLASAFAIMHPARRIMILPWPVPVRALTAILFFCGVSFMMIFTPILDFMAHSAHLGGALWGFFYMGLTGWYQQALPKVPSSLLENSDDFYPEKTLLESLDEKDIQRELPYLLKKLNLRGPENLSRMERAFLQKAHEKSLIQAK